MVEGWFGFLESPYELDRRNCYIGQTLRAQETWQQIRGSRGHWRRSRYKWVQKRSFTESGGPVGAELRGVLCKQLQIMRNHNWRLAGTTLARNFRQFVEV